MLSREEVESLGKAVERVSSSLKRSKAAVVKSV